MPITCRRGRSIEEGSCYDGDSDQESESVRRYEVDPPSKSNSLLYIDRNAFPLLIPQSETPDSTMNFERLKKENMTFGSSTSWEYGPTTRIVFAKETDDAILQYTQRDPVVDIVDYGIKYNICVKEGQKIEQHVKNISLLHKDIYVRRSVTSTTPTETLQRNAKWRLIFYVMLSTFQKLSVRLQAGLHPTENELNQTDYKYRNFSDVLCVSPAEVRQYMAKTGPIRDASLEQKISETSRVPARRDQKLLKQLLVTIPQFRAENVDTIVEGPLYNARGREILQDLLSYFMAQLRYNCILLKAALESNPDEEAQYISHYLENTVKAAIALCEMRRVYADFIEHHLIWLRKIFQLQSSKEVFRSVEEWSVRRPLTLEDAGAEQVISTALSETELDSGEHSDALDDEDLSAVRDEESRIDEAAKSAPESWVKSCLKFLDILLSTTVAILKLIPHNNSLDIKVVEVLQEHKDLPEASPAYLLQDDSLFTNPDSLVADRTMILKLMKIHEQPSYPIERSDVRAESTKFKGNFHCEAILLALKVSSFLILTLSPAIFTALIRPQLSVHSKAESPTT